MLLEAIIIEEGDHRFLAEDRAPILEEATKLCWLTCVCCELNGEELYRSKGISLFSNLVSRILSSIPRGSSNAIAGCRIMTYAIRTLAGLASFGDAQVDMATKPLMIHDVMQCLSFESSPSIVEASTHCISQMSKASQLQAIMMDMRRSEKKPAGRAPWKREASSDLRAVASREGQR